MTDYAYYDETSGAALPHEAKRHDFVLKKRMKTSAIIASNTTMTAAGKIAAGDSIQALYMPTGAIVNDGGLKMVVAEGGTATLDVGVGDGDQLMDGANINSAAGVILKMLLGDDWGPATLWGYDFESADTIDATYVNDTDTADFWLYVVGWMMW